MIHHTVEDDKLHLLKMLSQDSTIALGQSASSMEFEEYGLNDRVDIITTTLGSKPPKLPLREERQSLGVETVFKAKGVGWQGVRKKYKAEKKEKEKHHSLLFDCPYVISWNACGGKDFPPYVSLEDEKTFCRYHSTSTNHEDDDFKALTYKEYLEYLRLCQEKIKKGEETNNYLELEVSQDNKEATYRRQRIFTSKFDDDRDDRYGIRSTFSNQELRELPSSLHSLSMTSIVSDDKTETPNYSPTNKQKKQVTFSPCTEVKTIPGRKSTPKAKGRNRKVAHNTAEGNQIKDDSISSSNDAFKKKRATSRLKDNGISNNEKKYEPMKSTKNKLSSKQRDNNDIPTSKIDPSFDVENARDKNLLDIMSLRQELPQNPNIDISNQDINSAGPLTISQIENQSNERAILKEAETKHVRASKSVLPKPISRWLVPSESVENENIAKTHSDSQSNQKVRKSPNQKGRKSSLIDVATPRLDKTTLSVDKVDRKVDPTSSSLNNSLIECESLVSEANMIHEQSIKGCPQKISEISNTNHPSHLAQLRAQATRDRHQNITASLNKSISQESEDSWSQPNNNHGLFQGGDNPWIDENESISISSIEKSGSASAERARRLIEEATYRHRKLAKLMEVIETQEKKKTIVVSPLPDKKEAIFSSISDQEKEVNSDTSSLETQGKKSAAAATPLPDKIEAACSIKSNQEKEVITDASTISEEKQCNESAIPLQPNIHNEKEDNSIARSLCLNHSKEGEKSVEDSAVELEEGSQKQVTNEPAACVSRDRSYSSQYSEDSMDDFSECDELEVKHSTDLAKRLLENAKNRLEEVKVSGDLPSHNISKISQDDTYSSSATSDQKDNVERLHSSSMDLAKRLLREAFSQKKEFPQFQKRGLYTIEEPASPIANDPNGSKDQPLDDVTRQIMTEAGFSDLFTPSNEEGSLFEKIMSCEEEQHLGTNDIGEFGQSFEFDRSKLDSIREDDNDKCITAKSISTVENISTSFEETRNDEETSDVKRSLTDSINIQSSAKQILSKIHQKKTELKIPTESAFINKQQNMDHKKVETHTLKYEIPRSFSIASCNSSSSTNGFSLKSSKSLDDNLTAEFEIEDPVSMTVNELHRINSMLEDAESSCHSSCASENRDMLYYAKQTKQEIAALAQAIDRQVKDEESNRQQLSTTSTDDYSYSTIGGMGDDGSESTASYRRNRGVGSPLKRDRMVKTMAMDRLIDDVNQLCNQIESRIDNIVSDTQT